jgi:L-ascorbate metabolism protein UlaG (beta-lactamase superfamily)
MKMSIDTELKEGEIAFKWFNNYAGVTIKTPNRTIVVDPADVDPKEFTNVDIILITHEHYDHLDHAVIRDIYRRTNCKVLADPTSARRLRSVVDPEKLEEADVGREIEIEGIKVKVEGCNHPPAATPVTFLITSEDGLKIYHTADSLPFPEMERIVQKYKPSIVFCTVGIAP